METARDIENLAIRRSSESSSNSDLLKRTQQNDNFSQLEEKAKKDRYRLSAMLDSFRNSSNEDQTATTADEDDYTDADDFIINKGDSPIAKKSNRSSVIVNQEDIPSFDVPQLAITEASPKRDFNNKSNGSLNSFEFEKPELAPHGGFTHNSNTSSSSLNRNSMISDYTPSIHEVNEVHYVVDTHKSSDNVKPSPRNEAPGTPQEQTQTGESKPVIISRQPSIVRVRKGSGKSTRVAPIEGHSNKSSISSSEHKKNASYDSTVISTSGSSKYSGKDLQYDANVQIPEIVEEQKNQSQESFAFDIGPLHTEKKDTAPIAADRVGTTLLADAIPSRSPDRPISIIGPPLDRDKMHKSESVPSDQLSYLMGTIDDEIAKSPLVEKSQVKESSQNFADDAIETLKRNEEVELLQHHQVFRTVSQSGPYTHTKTESSQSNNPRPLPPPPLPKHDAKPMETKTSDGNDGYVTEDEVDENGYPIKKEKKHRKRGSKDKRKRISSGFKKGHLNHDTLVQLLQVTEGTIIGQEFQNIGLQPTEKQLLERLVDSLSRLTADMVIDSDRHDESVKRLNKAIRALEGF